MKFIASILLLAGLACSHASCKTNEPITASASAYMSPDYNVVNILLWDYGTTLSQVFNVIDQSGVYAGIQNINDLNAYDSYKEVQIRISPVSDTKLNSIISSIFRIPYVNAVSAVKN